MYSVSSPKLLISHVLNSHDRQPKVVLHVTRVTSALSLPAVAMNLWARSSLRLGTSACRFAHPRRPLSLRSLATPAQSFHSLNEDDLAHFSSILSESSILSTLAPNNASADELDSFNQDWMSKYKGTSKCVLKPKSVEEVSAILKYCYEKRIAVVPQGGNTGLVGALRYCYHCLSCPLLSCIAGGGVPIRDEVIISLANMSTVRSFDPVSGTAHISVQLLPRLHPCS